MDWITKKKPAMTGIDFLADTNFLIYLLEGRPETELFADFSFAVSFVTEIELLGRKGISETELQVIQALLDTCFIIELQPTIKEKLFTSSNAIKSSRNVGPYRCIGSRHGLRVRTTFVNRR